jgi:hypothetical protein
MLRRHPIASGPPLGRGLPGDAEFLGDGGGRAALAKQCDSAFPDRLLSGPSPRPLPILAGLAVARPIPPPRRCRFLRDRESIWAAHRPAGPSRIGLRPSSRELLLVQLDIAWALLLLQCPERAADRPVAGPGRGCGVGDLAPLGPVQLSVGVQVLQPQAPQRLVSGSCPGGGVGVMRCSRAVGATWLQPLAGQAFAAARRKLIG